MVFVTTVMWSLTLAIFFECVRSFKAYDYRSFFKEILGKFWFIFEILFVIAMLIVLAVVGSAAGVLLRDNFGIPYIVGVMIMFLAIGFHTFKGSSHIEKFLASWSIVLYTIYGIIFVTALLLLPLICSGQDSAKKRIIIFPIKIIEKGKPITYSDAMAAVLGSELSREDDCMPIAGAPFGRCLP